MPAPTELLKGNATLLILSCLDRGPLHGYGIVKSLESLSSDYFKMKEGTLYPHLHRMEEDRLIEGYWEQSAGNRERRIYRITQKGKIELSKLQNEWLQFQVNMNQVLDSKATA